MNASSSGIGVSGLGQIQLRVQDVDRAATFYQDIIGLKLLFKAPPHLAFLDCGGVRLMIAKPERPEFDHPSSILYFSVSDIQLAYSKMKEKNVRFEGEPHMIAKMPNHDLWMVFFHDGEGNLMALMSEVKHSG